MAVTQISSTLGYNQWVNPKVKKVGSDTYFTAIRSTDGDWYVQKLTSGTVTSQNMQNGTESDDHNAPSILYQSGKDIHVFFQRHGASTIINHWKSAGGSLSFSDQGNITFPGNVTYSQVLDKGDDVYLFCRSGSEKWCFKKSTNYASTFGSSVEFLNFSGLGNPYIIFQPSNSEADIWHFAIAQNPENSNDPYLLYGKVDLATGDVYSDGTSIANLDGTNLPLDKSDFTDILPTNRADQHIRLWDVTDINGQPVIGYTKWEDDSTTGNESRLVFAIGETTNWTWIKKDMEIGQGKVIYAPQGSHYEGGMCFDRNGNDDKFIVCWESAGTWRVKKHTVDADFNADAGTSLDSVLDSTAKLIRPVAVVGADQVMYMRATSYTSYTNFASGTYIADT